MKFALSKHSLRWAAAAILVTGLVSGCGRDYSKPPLDYVPHMVHSFAVKAQHLGPYGEGMRTPPEGTLPIDAPAPYRYPNDPVAAGRDNHNPLPRTKAVLVRGQKIFNTYCIVCHGVKGEGDGSVVPRFPRPPSLQSDKVRNWPDGNLYHVMTMGQNLMPSYATQIAPEDRWAVAHYVRVLQRAMNPTPADIKEIELDQAGGK